jgi:hypothetical protein
MKLISVLRVCALRAVLEERIKLVHRGLVCLPSSATLDRTWLSAERCVVLFTCCTTSILCCCFVLLTKQVYPASPPHTAVMADGYW